MAEVAQQAAVEDENPTRIRLANDQQRTTIYGQTGSGKTVAGMWQLSKRSWTTRPWLILDFKGDEHLNSIPGVREIAPGEIPEAAGLYIMHPVPESDDDLIERTLWQVWEHERIGVYIDEGYMIPRRSTGYKALLTQGRAKSIPVITLTQRPVWMTRFAISEADFHQIFFLSDQRDRDTVQGFIPYDVEERLPRFHSYYYDVGDDSFATLGPVPAPSEILNTFRQRQEKVKEQMPKARVRRLL
jgi:hypothetical protein